MLKFHEEGNPQIFNYVLIIRNTGELSYSTEIVYPPNIEEIPKTYSSVGAFCFNSPGKKTHDAVFSFCLTDAEKNPHYVFASVRSNVAYCVISDYFHFNFLTDISRIIPDINGHTKFLTNILSRQFIHGVSDWYFNEGLPGIIHYRRMSPRCELMDLYKFIFVHLPIHYILLLIVAIMLDNKIIVISSSLDMLSRAAYSLLSLIYPLTWPGSFIPICPEYMSTCLEAPFPYIIGIHSSISEKLLIDSMMCYFAFNVDGHYAVNVGQEDFPPNILKYIDEMAESLKITLSSYAPLFPFLQIQMKIREFIIGILATAYDLDPYEFSYKEILANYVMWSDEPSQDFAALISQSQSMDQFIRSIDSDEADEEIFTAFFPNEKFMPNVHVPQHLIDEEAKKQSIENEKKEKELDFRRRQKESEIRALLSRSSLHSDSYNNNSDHNSNNNSEINSEDSNGIRKEVIKNTQQNNHDNMKENNMFGDNTKENELEINKIEKSKIEKSISNNDDLKETVKRSSLSPVKMKINEKRMVVLNSIKNENRNSEEEEEDLSDTINSLRKMVDSLRDSTVFVPSQKNDQNNEQNDSLFAQENDISDGIQVDIEETAKQKYKNNIEKKNALLLEKKRRKSSRTNYSSDDENELKAKNPETSNQKPIQKHASNESDDENLIQLNPSSRVFDHDPNMSKKSVPLRKTRSDSLKKRLPPPILLSDDDDEVLNSDNDQFDENHGTKSDTPAKQRKMAHTFSDSEFSKYRSKSTYRMETNVSTKLKTVDHKEGIHIDSQNKRPPLPKPNQKNTTHINSNEQFAKKDQSNNSVQNSRNQKNKINKSQPYFLIDKNHNSPDKIIKPPRNAENLDSESYSSSSDSEKDETLNHRHNQINVTRITYLKRKRVPRTRSDVDSGKSHSSNPTATSSPQNVRKTRSALNSPRSNHVSESDSSESNSNTSTILKKANDNKHTLNKNKSESDENNKAIKTINKSHNTDMNFENGDDDQKDEKTERKNNDNDDDDIIVSSVKQQNATRSNHFHPQHRIPPVPQPRQGRRPPTPQQQQWRSTSPKRKLPPPVIISSSSDSDEKDSKTQNNRNIDKNEENIKLTRNQSSHTKSTRSFIPRKPSSEYYKDNERKTPLTDDANKLKTSPSHKEKEQSTKQSHSKLNSNSKSSSSTDSDASDSNKSSQKNSPNGSVHSVSQKYYIKIPTPPKNSKSSVPSTPTSNSKTRWSDSGDLDGDSSSLQNSPSRRILKSKASNRKSDSESSKSRKTSNNISNSKNDVKKDKSDSWESDSSEIEKAKMESSTQKSIHNIDVSSGWPSSSSDDEKNGNQNKKYQENNNNNSKSKNPQLTKNESENNEKKIEQNFLSRCDDFSSSSDENDASLKRNYRRKSNNQNSDNAEKSDKSSRRSKYVQEVDLSLENDQNDPSLKRKSPQKVKVEKKKESENSDSGWSD